MLEILFQGLKFKKVGFKQKIEFFITLFYFISIKMRKLKNAND